jgi:hypothetical protein
MKTVRILLTGCALLALAWPARAQEAAAPRPPVEFIIQPGEASAVPFKRGVSHANGGVIDVAQPNPTTLVITMSGLAATNADLIHTSIASYHFELNQIFELAFNSPRVKGATLTLEGRVEGLLRTDHQHYTHPWGPHHCGTATTDPALAGIGVGHTEILTVSLPPRAAGCCDDLSVYNHEGPLVVPITPGKYTLHGTWGFGTTHPCFCCRGASAEFSPQPASCEEGAAAYWFSEWHPFNGAATKDFGFQITVKVIPEFEVPKDKGEDMPPPKKDEKKEEKKDDKKDDKDKP